MDFLFFCKYAFITFQNGFVTTFWLEMKIINLQYVDHPTYFILWHDSYHGSFQIVFPGPLAAVSPGNLLEMQIP